MFAFVCSLSSSFCSGFIIVFLAEKQTQSVMCDVFLQNFPKKNGLRKNCALW